MQREHPVAEPYGRTRRTGLGRSVEHEPVGRAYITDGEECVRQRDQRERLTLDAARQAFGRARDRERRAALDLVLACVAVEQGGAERVWRGRPSRGSGRLRRGNGLRHVLGEEYARDAVRHARTQRSVVAHEDHARVDLREPAQRRAIAGMRARVMNPREAVQLIDIEAERIVRRVAGRQHEPFAHALLHRQASERAGIEVVEPLREIGDRRVHVGGAVIGAIAERRAVATTLEVAVGIRGARDDLFDLLFDERVVHAERLEDVRPHPLRKRFARHALDNDREDHVGAAVVLPVRAGCELELALPLHHADRVVARKDGVVGAVARQPADAVGLAVAARVREQVAERDFLVERGQLGNVTRHRVFDRQRAATLQQRDREGSELLGHAADVEARGRRDRHAMRQVRHAVSLHECDVAVHDHAHDTAGRVGSVVRGHEGVDRGFMRLRRGD